MYHSIQTQERFLSRLAEAQTPVAVYLKSGIKLTGTLMGMNREAIFLKWGTTQTIYKQAINSILPLERS